MSGFGDGNEMEVYGNRVSFCKLHYLSVRFRETEQGKVMIFFSYVSFKVQEFFNPL